jgi:hypothetical protein
MIEIECPTCEFQISVSRKLKVGDRLECPGCGEMLRVLSVDPLEIDYWEEGEEEQDEDDVYEEELPEELPSNNGLAGRGVGEEEENDYFELPEKSSLFEDEEETEAETEEADEELE